MARLRKLTSYNKCKRLLMTVIRLDLEKDIVVSRFGGGIAVRAKALKGIDVYRSISRWYDNMHTYNLKRYKDATKQKQRIR